MLSTTSYPEAQIDACRAQIDAVLAKFEKLANTKSFEPLFLEQMVLALDGHFVHRARAQEGKDGNPMNEVRMLCTSIVSGGGVLLADKTIKYKPEGSVVGLNVGDPIRMSLDDFRRLSSAFLDSIAETFGPK